MNKHQLSRRQFNAFSGAVSLALPAAVGMVEVLSAASVVAADAPQRAVKLRNSGSVPRSVRVLHVWAKGDIRKRPRKKRCGQAYRSG